MGRIADALKRAEQERHSTVRFDRGGVGARGREHRLEGAFDPSVSAFAPGDALATEAAPIVSGLSESLVTYYERSSVITEQYRSLRTRLLSQNPHYERRTIAITSADPKDGKSVTTLNLGIVLAEIRHLKVLVVDGDFRRGSLAKHMNQPESPGLADVLSGDAAYSDVVRTTPVPNLMFMPAGNTQDRPAAELLASAAAKPTFRRMQSEFHYTIIDTPPATSVTDVGIIGQLCTGVIVVVRLHRTEAAAAKRTVRLLQVNNVPILGGLVIGRDYAGGRFGSGGKPYPYYSYYGNDSRRK